MSERLRVRLAEERDREQIIELLMRAKRLNEEFDPLLKLSDELQQSMIEYVNGSLKSADSVVLVVEQAGKVVGVLKADIVKRVFYDPPLEGLIKELYILPEHRRKGVGKMLISEALRILKERGVGLITAEFPSQHKFATEFYEKMGFRPIVSKYAIETCKNLGE